MRKEIYYSNGKILLTGEYLVLQGADSLVLPLKLGQSLTISTSDITGNNIIYWKAMQFNTLWFEAIINCSDLSVIQTTDWELANKLIKIFKEIRSLRPELFELKESLKFETTLDFHSNWGLGSSSTLLTNLSKWASIDPFTLLKRVSNGSGYDIAAASSDTPFIYNYTKEKIKILPVIFNPVFSENLFFAYLGMKQDSSKEVENYLLHFHTDPKLIKKVSELSNLISLCSNYNDFENYIVLHEKLLADHLKKEPVKKVRFQKFRGAVKSLGAWGGDFVMMSSRLGKEYLVNYLKDTGIDIFFSFNELIKLNQLDSKMLTR